MCILGYIYTHVYAICWVHLALLVLTDVQGWPLGIGQSMWELVHEGNWFFFSWHHWRPVALHLGVGPYGVSPVHVGMFRVLCSWECMAHWPCHVCAVLSICRGPGLLPLPWCSLSFRVGVAASQGCPLEWALHCQCSLHFGQLCISVCALSMAVHIFNPSSWEAGVGGSLWVKDWSNLHSKFKPARAGGQHSEILPQKWRKRFHKK